MDKLPMITPPTTDDDALNCDVNLDDDNDNEITGIETNDMLDTKITASKVFGKYFNKKKKVIDNKEERILNEVISNNENVEVLESKDMTSQSIQPKVDESLVLKTDDKVESDTEGDKIVKRVRKKRVVSKKQLEALARNRAKGIETKRKKKLEKIERERQLLLHDEKDNIKAEIKDEQNEENFNNFLKNYEKMKSLKIKANNKKERLLEDKIKSKAEERRKKESIEKQILLEAQEKQKFQSINLLTPVNNNPYSNYFI